MKETTHLAQSAGIQSVDNALHILTQLRDAGGPVSLTELARHCELTPSKVHRYLASFSAADIVIQSGRSGKYDLGPGALQLGLAAMSRLDFVNRCSDAMAELRDQTDMTTMLSIWGTNGVTIVRWEKSVVPVVTAFGLGSTLPLLTSATGRVFLTWASPASLVEQLHKERKKTQLDIEDIRRKTARAGYSSVAGKFIPGLVACAAPVLDWQQQIQCAITLVGTDPQSVKAGSDTVKALLDFCAQKSIAGPD